MQMKLALHGGTIEVRGTVWEYSTEELGRILYDAKTSCGDDMRTLDTLIALGAVVVSFERDADYVPGRVY